MMNCLQTWPEPIVRVQSLSDSGITVIPERYIKPPSDRPSSPSGEVSIPVIDLGDLSSDNDALRQATRDLIASACREWGFFQVVNHGVSHELMARTREAWRLFFEMPAEVKQAYANAPSTYVGYGSRLGVEKGAKLDWSDYFFLNYLPLSMRDEEKWPTVPPSCRYYYECARSGLVFHYFLDWAMKSVLNFFGPDQNSVGLGLIFSVRSCQSKRNIV